LEKFKYAEVKRYVELVANSEISELEISEEGATIRIKKEQGNISGRAAIPAVSYTAAPAPAAVSGAEISAPAASASSRTTEVKAARNIIEVKSPMVGTFYRAPSPEAEPYVQVGDKVKPGQVLCIVEAMKLMNEIECDISGTIADILVENGKPVEFEQVLFTIVRE